MTTAIFVPTAEAAYIAGLSDKQIQRVVDEHIVDEPLVQLQNGRRFARLTAAFARFYFDLEDVLTAGARREAINQVSKRVLERSDVQDLMDLKVSPSVMSWEVSLNKQSVTLHGYVVDAQARVAQVDHAHRAIVEDAAVMGGMPVFKGTRVPVDTVMAMVRSGRAPASLKEDFPFLTPELLESAETYVAVHPRRGRPVRLSSPPASWKLRSRKTIRPASPAE